MTSSRTRNEEIALITCEFYDEIDNEDKRDKKCKTLIEDSDVKHVEYRTRSLTVITLFPMMFLRECTQTVHAKGSIVNSTPAGTFLGYERLDTANSRSVFSYFLSFG